MSEKYQDATLRTRRKKSLSSSTLMSMRASLRSSMIPCVSYFFHLSTNATSKNSSAPLSDQPSYHLWIFTTTRTAPNSSLAILNLRSYKYPTSYHIIFHLQLTSQIGKLVTLSTLLSHSAPCQWVRVMMPMLCMAQLQKISLPKTNL